MAAHRSEQQRTAAIAAACKTFRKMGNTYEAMARVCLDYDVTQDTLVRVMGLKKISRERRWY
jgi:hypothetical protein